jgi:hypothetical protein
MEGVRSLRGLPFVVRTAFKRVVHPNPLDHEDLVLDVDLALSL